MYMVLEGSKHRYGGAVSVLGRLWDSVVVVRRLGRRVQRRGTDRGEIGDRWAQQEGRGGRRRPKSGGYTLKTAVTVLIEIKKLYCFFIGHLLELYTDLCSSTMMEFLKNVIELV